MQLEAVMKHFEEKGFKRTKKKSGNKHESETALDKYVARMTIRLNKGKGVDHVNWLTPNLAYRVLEALKQWHKREMIEWMSNSGKLPRSADFARDVNGIMQFTATTQMMQSISYDRVSEYYNNVSEH